jgi:hypothetical protein
LQISDESLQISEESVEVCLPAVQMITLVNEILFSEFGFNGNIRPGDVRNSYLHLTLQTGRGTGTAAPGLSCSVPISSCSLQLLFAKLNQLSLRVMPKSSAIQFEQERPALSQCGVSGWTPPRIYCLIAAIKPSLEVSTGVAGTKPRHCLAGLSVRSRFLPAVIEFREYAESFRVLSSFHCSLQPLVEHQLFEVTIELTCADFDRSNVVLAATMMSIIYIEILKRVGLKMVGAPLSSEYFLCWPVMNGVQVRSLLVFFDSANGLIRLAVALCRTSTTHLIVYASVH